jgi:O-antigen polymerase
MNLIPKIALSKPNLLALVLVILPLSAVIFPCYPVPYSQEFTNQAKFYSLVAAISLGLLISVLKAKKSAAMYAFQIDAFGALICLWVAYTIFSGAVCGHPTDSKQALSLLSGLAIYFFIRGLLSIDERGLIKSTVLHFLLISAIVEAGFAILQTIKVLPSLNLDFPVTGTFSNPAPLALFLSCTLPASLAVLTAKTTPVASLSKFLALFSLILSLTVLLKTGIRSALLGSAAGTIILLEIRFGVISAFFSRIASRRKFVIATTFFSLVILISFTLFSLYKWKQDSANGRVLIWKISAINYLKSPILGVGYGNFSTLYNRWQSAFFKADINRQNETYFFGAQNARSLAGNVKTAYNEYLEIAVETGAIGLLLFLVAIGKPLYNSTKNVDQLKKPLFIASYVGTITILFASVTSYPLHSLPTLVSFFLFVGIISPTSKSIMRGKGFSKEQPGTSRVSVYATILTALSLSILFAKFALPGLSLRNWVIAKSYMSLDNKEMAADYYEKCYPEFKNVGDYLLDYGECLNSTGHFTGALSILNEAKNKSGDPRLYELTGFSLQNIGLLDSAALEYETASHMIPHLLYPSYLLAELYIQKGDTPNVVKYARAILANPPKVESAKTDYIIREMMDVLNTYSQSSKKLKI